MTLYFVTCYPLTVLFNEQIHLDLIIALHSASVNDKSHAHISFIKPIVNEMNMFQDFVVLFVLNIFVSLILLRWVKNANHKDCLKRQVVKRRTKILPFSPNFEIKRLLPQLPNYIGEMKERGAEENKHFIWINHREFQEDLQSYWLIDYSDGRKTFSVCVPLP
jgi:hypothetical protein